MIASVDITRRKIENRYKRYGYKSLALWPVAGSIHPVALLAICSGPLPGSHVNLGGSEELEEWGWQQLNRKEDFRLWTRWGSSVSIQAESSAKLNRKVLLAILYCTCSFSV